MACRLREVRPHAPSVLPAQIARIIALTALTTLGLPGAQVHEPVHARRPHVTYPATVRNTAKSAQRTSAWPALAIMGADGFTVLSCLHLYMPSDLRKHQVRIAASTLSAYLHCHGDRKWVRDGPFTV